MGDRVCEAKTLMRPTGGHMVRAKPVETLVFKPIPRERPSGEKPYGLRPREKQVEVPKLKERPVDGWEYEPFYRVRPAGYKVKTVVPEERPDDNQGPRGKPINTRTQKPRSEATPDNDETHDPMPRKGPIAISGSVIGPVKPMRYDVTPRDEGDDNQSNKSRPADDETEIPTPDERPDTGLQTLLSPKGGEDETEAVLLPREAPPPSEVPDWSEGEAMPLIIIENSSEMPAPTKTNEGLLTESDLPLSKYQEMNSSGDQGGCRRLCRQIGSEKAILRICQRKEVCLMCLQTSRDFTCDRLGALYNRQISHRPRLRITSASITRFSGHRLRLLSAKARREWIPRRRCPSTVYQRTVVLVWTSRQYRRCTPREFRQTLFPGRPRRISYGIS